MAARRRLFGHDGLLGEYRLHPDPRQEALFWALLRECLDDGDVSEAFLREEMARGHLRTDALEHLATAPPVEVVLGGLSSYGARPEDRLRRPGDRAGATCRDHLTARVASTLLRPLA